MVRMLICKQNTQALLKVAYTHRESSQLCAWLCGSHQRALSRYKTGDSSEHFSIRATLHEPESEKESESTSRKATLGNCFGNYAGNGYGRRIRIMDCQLGGSERDWHRQVNNTVKSIPARNACVHAILAHILVRVLGHTHTHERKAPE